MGVPLVAVRDLRGQVRTFRNACRHRGMEVARGAGCAKALVCPYHGWTYGLDGGLRHLPHADGFPDVDRSVRGLVEVPAVERHGLVFVTQDGPSALPDEIDGLIAHDHDFSGVSEQTEAANWKILTETFLEGLHIRFLHRHTFFPVQYDNTNVVEHFGPHSRVTFPFRNITRLADQPPAERSIEDKLGARCAACRPARWTPAAARWGRRGLRRRPLGPTRARQRRQRVPRVRPLRIGHRPLPPSPRPCRREHLWGSRPHDRPHREGRAGHGRHVRRMAYG
jgi:phenylpropionate dioxygenase-like ring-hydroxylating dioxygenase large terminal subunit